VNVWNTLDGVAAGGARLAQAIRGKQLPPGSFLSFVCHSLGGIYARWALRSLEIEGWFETSGVIPVNFVTTATPHLGILEIGSFWRFGIKVLGLGLGRTVRDLALGSTMLQELADEDGLRSLSRFKRRAAYGNLVDDLWVRSSTALLLPSPPELSCIPAGLPVDVRAGDLAAADFRAFPSGYHGIVKCMLCQLCGLQWERYAVNFPTNSKVMGSAHAKICQHAHEDPGKCGVHVVFHISHTFVDPATSEEKTTGS